MPYTPPVAQATVAAGPDTSSLSCFPSDFKSQQRDDTISGHESRTDIHSLPSPRAYLNKHRRSPSISKSPSFTAGFPTPDALALEINSSDSDDNQNIPHALGNSRQSSTDSSISSTEISPPFPPPTSRDDENTTRQGRLGEDPNLAELQATIGTIDQHRLGLPHMPASEKKKNSKASLGLPFPRLHPSNKNNGPKPELSPSVFISTEVRKVLHLRSSAGTSALSNFPRNKLDLPPRSASEDETYEIGDDRLWRKPALIHKKSGELVRPVLRASSRRRHSNMPESPIRPKAVHFHENDMEHVRLFLQGERPSAINASSSPGASNDDEINFPFDDHESRSRSPPFDWEIQLNDFPRQFFERTPLSVRIEQIYLSSDTKILVGIVAVRNLAFHKSVVVRFTLDYWKTISEIVAEFDDDIFRRQIKDGCDRFVFRIKLDDQTHLEEKTMFFCVRYNVNGQEYWDNNSSINYQVNFSKRFKPQNGEPCMQAENAYLPDALPRNKPPPASASKSPSMPPSDDLLPLDWFSSFPQPSAMVGSSLIGLENGLCAKGITPHVPSRRRDPLYQQVLGDRYDCGTSLAVAVQAAYAALGDRSKVRLGNHVTSVSERQPASQIKECERPRATKIQSSVDAGITVTNIEVSQPLIPVCPEPVAVTVKKFPLGSSSYSELLDNYCFVSSEHDQTTRRW